MAGRVIPGVIVGRAQVNAAGEQGPKGHSGGPGVDPGEQHLLRQKEGPAMRTGAERTQEGWQGLPGDGHFQKGWCWSTARKQ